MFCSLRRALSASWACRCRSASRACARRASSAAARAAASAAARAAARMASRACIRSLKSSMTLFS
ncbi:hypothetical protein FX016_13515 [Cupriavidus gilardii]|nr:hypothetical protein FX016_13515 [Cupriavidus gilardii]